MIQVREFTNGADVLAHAAEIRRKFYGPRQVAPAQVITVAETATVEPNLSAETRQECETFPVEADSLETASTPSVVLDDDTFTQKLAEWLVMAGTPSLANHNRAMQIVRECAERHDLTPADIFGQGQRNYIVKARHEAMAGVYVAMPEWSLPKMGKFFGGRHHATILHAAKKMGVWKGGAQ